MTRREDIQHVLVIGSGPIVIGQACEFDYSGTIMTDPEYADATYVEPITLEHVTKVIEAERPDALPATLKSTGEVMGIDTLQHLEGLGLTLVATKQAARVLRRHGVEARVVDLRDAATLVDLLVGAPASVVPLQHWQRALGRALQPDGGARCSTRVNDQDRSRVVPQGVAGNRR